jgi:hypothetical protein
MNARLVRTKASGQTLPLIALVIVVVIAMVGLAVDVGNTYAQQRNTVRSSNAAALSGMSTLIKNGSDTNVYNAIKFSLKSNGIEVPEPGSAPAPGQREMVANYLDASGNPIPACPIVGSCPSATMSKLGVTYIRVEVKGKVETFFARVVNANTLPVGANAWAARGPCSSGIYPITVRDDFLGPNGWVKPDSTYSDNTYKGRTLKRVYLKDPTNPNGGFSWLKWKDGQQYGTAQETEAMLTGDGNIDEGYEEAPWPNNPNLPAKPDGYPIEKGQINADEWVRGNSGINASTGVKAQLDYHITYRTEMILPIHDYDDGNGINGNYHITRLGTFLLRGYNLTGQGWFDLVYIGNAAECPALVTPPSRTINPGLIGQVFYRPRYKEIPSSRPPVEYQIILDVSGSMTWNYAGQAGSSSNKTQCTGVVYTNPCDNGWSPKSERRIYIAKQAIKAFIDQMNANDMMQIVSYSGNLTGGYSNQRAIDNLTDASDWTSDKAALKTAVDNAGAVDSDPYKTQGRTSSATAIAAGTQEFAQAPDTQDYKKVTIFLTDGVANVLRDGRRPDSYYPAGCGSEIAKPCNTGDVPGTNPAVPMPIKAMIGESDALKNIVDTLYVIAMAGVDETGLQTVASAPNYPYFSSSTNGNDLKGIFDNIATNVKYGECVPSGGNKWIGKIDESEVGDVPPADGGPLSYPTVGKAYLLDQNGSPLPGGKGEAAVIATGDALTFQFSNLTPGTYQLRAFVAYRGADDI